MPEAISNTSPLLYLYRTGALEWLPELFSEIWIPRAVVLELEEGCCQRVAGESPVVATAIRPSATLSVLPGDRLCCGVSS